MWWEVDMEWAWLGAHAGARAAVAAPELSGQHVDTWAHVTVLHHTCLRLLPQLCLVRASVLALVT